MSGCLQIATDRNIRENVIGSSGGKKAKYEGIAYLLWAHPIEPTFMHVMDTHTSMSYHRTVMACHHTFVAYLSCKSAELIHRLLLKFNEK